MKRTFNIIMLVLCGAFFFTCALGSSSSDGDLDKKSKKDELEIIETKGYKDKYNISYYVEGKAKNVTDKKFSYVQLSFNVYDADGAVIGTCFDNQSDVAGGETWKFKAICSGEAKDVKSFKYTGYSAY